MTTMASDGMTHGWAIDLLRRQMERGSLHHAYLISGPEGVGRRSLAMWLAAALLCEQPPAPGETCGACRACRQVPQATYPDLHIVERGDDRQGISIEQVRELQRQLALSPLAGGRRVALIHDVDRASLGAANALLKTLEEPPPRVVLVLTAIDPEDMPPTIVSRCETLALRPLPTAVIAAALERRGARPAEAEEWARLSAGRPTWAMRLMDDPAMRKRRAEHATAFREILSGDLEQRFALAGVWTDRKSGLDDESLEERLSVWLVLAGDALHSESPPGSGQGGEGHLTGRIEAREAVQVILRTLDGLRHNVNPRLALELMMLDLPRSG